MTKRYLANHKHKSKRMGYKMKQKNQKKTKKMKSKRKKTLKRNYKYGGRNRNKMTDTIMNNDWFDYILEHPDKPWDYSRMSSNPNITWDIVEENPDVPWDYIVLSANKMRMHPFFTSRQLSYVLK